MKKIKSIILSLCIVLSACFASGFGFVQTPKQASAAPLNASAFNYVTLVQSGKPIRQENMYVDDEGGAYVVANGAITIKLKPFAFNYSEITAAEEHFEAYQSVVELQKDEDGNYPTSFVFEGATYSVELQRNTTSAVQNIIFRDETGRRLVDSSSSGLISFTETETHDNIKITIITAYQLKATAPSATFTFSITGREFSFDFVRPSVNFGKYGGEPILEFTTDGEDVDTYLAPEQEFSNVKMKILSNDYTRINPLFFDINYNGFTYNFILYCENVDDKDLLFVEYYDITALNSSKSVNEILKQIDSRTYDEETQTNDTSLASSQADNPEKKEVLKMNGEESNLMAILFDQTGRYEISIYDSTYLLGLENQNFYSTSFYIKSTENSNFDNIYTIAQTVDSSGNDGEYIVSTSTQNYNVKVTIKNLLNILETESEHSLEDVIEKIEIHKIIYGTGDNIEETKSYTPAEILNILQSGATLEENLGYIISGEDGNLLLNFEEDADYGVYIFPRGETNATNAKTYVVTVAKDIKTHYNANGHNDSADALYHTKIINYDFNISHTITFKWNFDSSEAENPDGMTTELSKNYVNRYSIKYGMQRVLVERYQPEGENIPGGLYLRLFGVGDMDVEITYNGVAIASQRLNSEIGNNTLYFADYGVYTIKLVDSMGTTTVETFDYKQSINISTVLLIVFSSILVAGIVLFILIVRGRVKTR